MRVLRHTSLLVILALGEFLMMAALELLYFRQLSGGLPSLDVRAFGFTAGEATAWLAAIGPSGAQTILVWHYLTFDLIFPALLAAALASLIIHFGRSLPRFAKLPERVQTLLAAVLVLPYMGFDYAQNLAVASILADPFQAKLETILLASSLVVLKFAFGVIPVLVIVLFALAGHKRTNRIG